MQLRVYSLWSGLFSFVQGFVLFWDICGAEVQACLKEPGWSSFSPLGWLFKAEFSLAELHSFCLLPSSSSEGSFSFPSLYGFLVNMLCCNRTSQWKSKLPLFQSVNISWNNVLSFEIFSKEYLKTSLHLSVSHLIGAAFHFLLCKPLPGNLVKEMRILCKGNHCQVSHSLGTCSCLLAAGASWESLGSSPRSQTWSRKFFLDPVC